MSLLIESIRLLDGEFYNLSGHEQRMMRALRLIYGVGEPLSLKEFLLQYKVPAGGLYKCRITYNDVDREVEFVPYTPRTVKTLRTVVDNNIVYEHKYNDRRALDALFALRGDCDDILIIKDNMVTDSYYANIVFKQDGAWYTPWSALLNGTMRQRLLEKGLIKMKAIRRQDIRSFQSFKLINAMVGFEGPEIDTVNIEV